MIQTDLELALRDLPNIATAVRQDRRRSIWQFSITDKTLLLYHFPRGRGWTVNPALQMFTRSQSMAKLQIPTPRAAAQLAGYTLAGEAGDAVIMEATPGATQLDAMLRDAARYGGALPHRRSWSAQIAEILAKLGRAGWRFGDLSLANFLVADDRVWLHDLRGLQRGAVRLKDVWRLGAAVTPGASRSELLRGWRSLNPGGTLPRKNPLATRRWRTILQSAEREGPIASRFIHSDWSGLFTHAPQHAPAWSAAGRLNITAADWQAQWPTLLREMGNNQLTLIKRDGSGEVFVKTLMLAGQPVEIIIKRPFRKYWYRYITDVTRGGAKALRTYRKAWQLIARGVPCEWPLLMMERRIAGYPLDGVIIFERVPGVRLDQYPFDRLSLIARETLFRRCGRITRKIEQGGLAHYDAKTTNWIIVDSPCGAPSPVIIDVDGVRPLNNGLVAFGVRRLLRALRNHPQFTPADSLAVCQGYAPFARQMIVEGESA